MRFRSCGKNEFERVWTLFVSVTSPKCIDREQTRQREQREQSIYQLFWYLSANVALGIYFKNSLETKWSHLGPKPFQSFSPWLYVTPWYTWKLNYFGSNFKLKKINNNNKTVATWGFKNFYELTVSYSLHYTLASFFMSHTFSRMMSIRFLKELVIRIW